MPGDRGGWWAMRMASHASTGVRSGLMDGGEAGGRVVAGQELTPRVPAGLVSAPLPAGCPEPTR